MSQTVIASNRVTEVGGFKIFQFSIEVEIQVKLKKMKISFVRYGLSLSIVLSICRCTLPLNSYTHTDWLLPTTKWVVAISEAITALLMRLGVPIAQKRRHVADEVCNPFQGIVPRPQRPGNVLRTLLLGPDPKHDNGLNF